MYAACHPQTSSPQQCKLSRLCSVLWHSAAQQVLASGLAIIQSNCGTLARQNLHVLYSQATGSPSNVLRLTRRVNYSWRSRTIVNCVCSIPAPGGEAVRVTEGHGPSQGRGKGDENIRCYEYEGDKLCTLDEHKSSDPQRGMWFVPRRAVNISECEIARAYKTTSNCRTNSPTRSNRTSSHQHP